MFFYQSYRFTSAHHSTASKLSRQWTVKPPPIFDMVELNSSISNSSTYSSLSNWLIYSITSVPARIVPEDHLPGLKLFLHDK